MEPRMDMSEIAAWWGATVATLVLMWDVFKWRNDGPKLGIRLSPNMKVFGDPLREDKTWITVTVSNNGSRATTIKSIGMEYYTGAIAKLRNKVDQAAIFPRTNDEHPLPVVLYPGQEWIGLVPQYRDDEDLNIEKLAKKGWFIIWLSVSHKVKPIQTRLQFR